jgi:hypothetical protein
MEVTIGDTIGAIPAGGTGFTSTTTSETLVVIFTFTPTTTLATTEATGNVRIQLRGASSAPDAPTFASNTQFSGAVVRVLSCASYLLFPWVAYTGDGAVDTGLAIANTTKDPPVIGTLGQAGDVTLYFWRAAGGTNPVPVKIATALAAGQTATYVISQLGAPFQGYVIAHCTFQMGHGLAAFLSGGAFNGYIAQVINNPRLSPIDVTVTESSGH